MGYLLCKLTGLFQGFIIEAGPSDLERMPLFAIYLFVQIDDMQMLVLDSVSQSASL